jgi:uncharacterized protein YjbJ (UPF0337 family)
MLACGERPPSRDDLPAEVVFRPACKLGFEGIVSKRLGSPYRSGRDWLKMKNPKAPAVKREAAFVCALEANLQLSCVHWNVFASRPLARRKPECVMDWNRIEGNWKQFKGQVKEKWGRLTDDDLDVINGRQDQLEGKIQERYGLAKDQAKKDVESWFNSLP